MTLEPKALARLQFLARVIEKECRDLRFTDQRLFTEAFTPARAGRLAEDPDLAERVEAFVGRFGRLQDTLGDKLLPHLLAAATPYPSARRAALAARMGAIASG